MTPGRDPAALLLSGLRHRDEDAVELMDDAGCDLAALDRTYADFRFVNALVAGWRRTYVRLLRPRLPRHRTATLLDIGSGGGDVARSLARWARRDGLDLRVTGIDPDERAHAWAAARPGPDGVEFLCAGSGELVAQGRSFDVVVSNHVLHHLRGPAFREFLDDSALLAAGGVVHGDIRRSPWAYRLYALGTAPLLLRPPSRASFVRVDGMISVRRSFTAAELREAAPAGWKVVEQAPWRNLLIRKASPEGG
jgi:2-polyprenyl-3-methyl-5-hydroxy-6-metoxy-1,4-benzoquinol methylase